MRRHYAALAVAGAFALSACGTQQASSVAALAPLAAVKAAADATTSAGTATITLTMTTTIGGKDVSIVASGPMALDGSKADISMTLPAGTFGGSGGDITLRELIVDKTVYLKFSGTSAIPSTWFSVTKGDLLGKAGLGNLSAATGVKGTLSALREIGDVTTIGTETVNGVQTTHYRAQVDPAKSAALLSGSGAAKAQEILKSLGTAKIPADVWIDGSSHVVKLTEKFTFTLSGQTVSESIESDLSDFGAPVNVTAPTGATDLSSLLGK